MKKIGIAGGVGWQSTVDYYSEICRRSQRCNIERGLPDSLATPEMSIESLDHIKAASYLGIEGQEASWARFDEYHRTALQRLEASGADFALIASNAPHHRLKTITRGVRIPVISIFEAAAKESARIGARQVLILGTALTMTSRKLRQEFSRCGIEAAGPEDEVARAKTVELIAGLQLDQVDGAAEQLGNIARDSFQRKFSGQPIVCLACTELPLAFPAHKSLATFETDGVCYINSTIVHVNAALDFAMDRASP